MFNNVISESSMRYRDFAVANSLRGPFAPGNESSRERFLGNFRSLECVSHHLLNRGKS